MRYSQVIFKSSRSWMCPWSELCCFHFVPREPLLCTKFSFFHLQWFVISCRKSVLSSYGVTVITSDKEKKMKRYGEVFDTWIQRHQSKVFKMNQSENCRKTSCFLRGQRRTNQKKAKLKFGS